MDDVRKHFTPFYRPGVGILASPDAEKLLLKSDLSLVELFSEFSTIDKAEAFSTSLNPGSNENKIDAFALEYFSIRFIDLCILNKINENLPKKIVTNMVLNCVNRKSFRTNTVSPDTWTTYSYQNYTHLNNQFEDESASSNYVNAMHAALFVVSSDEDNLVESFTSLKTKFDLLLNNKNSIRNYMIRPFNDDILKYYLVLHTPNDKPNSTTEKNLESDCFIQENFNDQGYHLLINSGLSAPMNMRTVSYYHMRKGMKKPKVESGSGDPLSSNLLVNDKKVKGQLDGNNRLYRQYFVYPSPGMTVSKRVSILNQSDLLRVKDFIIAFVSNSLIPHLAKSYLFISQAIQRKNTTLSIINSAKNFFKIKKKPRASQEQLNTSINSSEAVLQNVPQDVLQKKCADVLFIMQKYALARQMYLELLKLNDLSCPSIRISSIELLDVCNFLCTGKCTIGDGNIRRLLTAYGGKRQICRLMHVMAMINYFENRYTDVVFLLSKFSEKLSNTEKAIIYEQAAEFYNGNTIRLKRIRSRSFFFMTAAKTYEQAKLPWHQVSCLLKASDIFKMSSWTAITSSYLSMCVQRFNDLRLHEDAYVYSLKLLKYINYLSSSNQLEMLTLITELVANHQNKKIGVLHEELNGILHIVGISAISVSKMSEDDIVSSECTGCILSNVPKSVERLTSDLFKPMTLKGSQLCASCLYKISTERSDDNKLLCQVLHAHNVFSAVNIRRAAVNFSKTENSQNYYLKINNKYKLQFVIRNPYKLKIVVSSVIFKCTFSSSSEGNYLLNIPATSDNIEIDSVSSSPIHFILSIDNEAVLESISCVLTITFAKRSNIPTHQDRITEGLQTKLTCNTQYNGFSSESDLLGDSIGLNHDNSSEINSLMTNYTDSVCHMTDCECDACSVSSLRSDTLCSGNIDIGKLDDLDNHPSCKLETDHKRVQFLDENYSLSFSMKVEEFVPIKFISTKLREPTILISNWNAIRGATIDSHSFLSLTASNTDDTCYIYSTTLDIPVNEDNGLSRVGDVLFKLSSNEAKIKLQSNKCAKSDCAKLKLNKVDLTILWCRSSNGILQYASYHFMLRYYGISFLSFKPHFCVHKKLHPYQSLNFPKFDLNLNNSKQYVFAKHFEFIPGSLKVYAYSKCASIENLKVNEDMTQKFPYIKAVYSPNISSRKQIKLSGSISQEVQDFIKTQVKLLDQKINELAFSFYYEIRHTNLKNSDGTACMVSDCPTLKVLLPDDIESYWIKRVQNNSGVIDRHDFSYMMDTELRYDEKMPGNYIMFHLWNLTEKTMHIKLRIIQCNERACLLWIGKISQCADVKPSKNDDQKCSFRLYYHCYEPGVYETPSLALELVYEDCTIRQLPSLYNIQIGAFLNVLK